MPKKAPQVNEKTPDESAPFDFDFSEDLVTGETITGSPVMSATPSGLNLGVPSVNGSIVQVRISAGTARTTYDVRCKITTSQSNTYEGSGDLIVNEPSR
jgi:hypothetical protein